MDRLGTLSLDALGTLYEKPVRATRGGALYNAFSYPTKISPETAALFIASHTQPGAVVFDGFAGSGSTGLGVLLAANPPELLKQLARKLGMPVTWGPRRAVLYEIGVLGSLIGRVLCAPPDPNEFRRAATELLDETEKEFGWVYGAHDPENQVGSIRFVVWSDVLECPRCKERTSLWDACVTLNPASIDRLFRCPVCGCERQLDDVERLVEVVHDDLLGRRHKRRQRCIGRVYGATERHMWARSVCDADLDLVKRLEDEPIPSSVPVAPISWGDLFRSGYHEGMTHLHHFYTRRNLIALGRLWDRIGHYPSHLTDALRFWILSYNAAHSTIMARVVAKKDHDDLVVTGAQTGVLYVSGLPVEKNIFRGLRHKLKTIVHAFSTTHGHSDLVEVRNASSLTVELGDGTVDYIFTDPPFGGNIPYAEINFINEAWLGSITDNTDEAIISPHQHKGIDEYEQLLTTAFQEAYRILNKNGVATVVFHSASADVWNALQLSLLQAGFRVADISFLNRTQRSFKQVTASTVRDELILLLTKTNHATSTEATELREIVDHILEEADKTNDPEELTSQQLYSRMVSHYVARHQAIPLNASDFYNELANRQAPSRSG